MSHKIVLKCKNYDFWQVGNEVYRANKPYEISTEGLPMGMRWECSIKLFDTFKNIFEKEN